MISRGASSSRTSVPSSSGNGGIESVPRSLVSTMLQAFTAGLHREAASYAAGRKDGEEGAGYRPLPDWSPELALLVLRSGDQAVQDRVFSYSCGYISGRQTHALRSNRN